MKNSEKKKAYLIEVKGIVQGVGFRPFIYRLANKLNINGSVANTTQGVIIKTGGLSNNELKTFVIKNPHYENEEPKKIEKFIIPDSKILQRIEQVENYAHIDDLEKEIEVRRQAYNSFDDITEYLTIEEKWWFFEMLDEMKRYEPHYPKNLKKAFVELYRTGIKQSQNMQFKLKEKHIVHKL